MRIARRTIRTALASALLFVAAGCQSVFKIPETAHLEQAGSGVLSFTTHEPGNVYVLDTDLHEKVFEGRANTGDQIVVKPDQDQIVVAGTTVNHSQTLKPDHHYAIYFDPQS